MQAVGLVDRVPGFMPEYPPAFGLARSLDLQHLAALQPHQARMCEIEGNGEPEHAIRVEELLRQPGMRQRDDVVRLQLAMQTLDPARHQRAFQLQRQVAQARRQQGLVAGVLEHERAARALPAVSAAGLAVMTPSAAGREALRLRCVAATRIRVLAVD